MREELVSITQGRDGRLALRPAGALTMRRLSAALRNAGVTYEAEPGSPFAIVRADAIDAVLHGLKGWSVKLAPGVKDLVGAAADREQRHIRALAVCRRLAEDPAAARAELEGYAGLDVLDPHQVIAVAAASHPAVDGICIFDEQGLGKTVEALFAFDRLHETGIAEKAVIFAPKNMVLEWISDLERFFPGRYRASAIVGTDAEKRTALDGRADIYVTNFETANRLGPRLVDVLGSAGLLIVDESFFVKNANSLRTTSVKRIRSQAARCIVLCGTPAPNSAADLVEQFNIADGGAAFMGIELPTDPAELREVVGEIVAKRGVYLRRLKAQVFELPSRSFNRIEVPLEPRQRSLYDSYSDHLASEVREVSNEEFARRRATFAARRMALLQICSNPAAVDPAYDAVPGKLEALDELLLELIDRRGEKVLVWSFFTRSLDAIVARYGRYRPVRIDGTVTRAEDRREAVRRFQQEDDTMLFIGNPAAAGAGLTLHSARHAIYESMSNQAAHYLQSLDRIHRRGQQREVEYHVLLASRTIEESEYGRLLAKELAAQDLLRDEVVAPVTREGFLSDLLAATSMSKAPQANPV
ncbi:DEAD/DEAH box helicase [Sphingomonas sp. LY54]|uniref:DEAD/DEAH box helicase n=1 Tax=Sphingomonas sp. LY54 TaxID=3095343 RepID=UPI002D77A227|nr:DEAD/DEAH box helicase [Sphingomonas sp. LY54]WRP29787.1 DEAD/DEAH box helicase [Sphingomonas sp. LY54]